MNCLVLLCTVVAGASGANIYQGIVLGKPSRAVTRDGNNIQHLPDEHRVERDVGFVNNKGSFDLSRVVRSDSTIKTFSAADIDNIVPIGPPGVVTRDGRNWHLDENLYILCSKSNLVGESGIITRDGIPFQFKKPESPSGLLLSDDTQVQLRSKRATNAFCHTYGDPGIIIKDGDQYQLTHGVSVRSN